MKILVMGFCLLGSINTFADNTGPLRFNDNTLTYQEGDHYQIGDAERGYMTFEHISAWTWGDIFLFRDWIHEKNSDRNSYYTEFSPRLSLSYVSGTKLTAGPINDVLIATTFEQGSNDFKAQLLGIGFNWAMPGFTHFESNLYYRDTDHLNGHTWQVTLAWSAPFSLGVLDFLCDGYLDTRGNESLAKHDLNFNPQLKIDIGKFFSWPRHLYSGIEYYYWNNKFGIDGINERNISALMQIHFPL